MKTVFVNDNTRTGKRIIRELRKHPKTVWFTDSESTKDESIPNGYVTAIEAEEHLWKEFNKCYGTNVRP